MSAQETTAYSQLRGDSSDSPNLPARSSSSMGAMFRSEEMALCQLFLQPEAAYSIISELGEQGCVQFIDLNENVNSFQRKFATEVKRCDEMERQLRYIEAEINKDSIKVPELEQLPRAPFPREMITMENNLEKTETDIVELSQNAKNLKLNYFELLEMKHVLELSQQFLSQPDSQNRGRESMSRSFIEEESSREIHRGRLGFVAGVVDRERIPAFERMLWRISRGNVFLRQAVIEKPFEDPITGNEVHKTVFVAFFQGEQLKSRVLKVCTGFRASLYPVPESSTERGEMLQNMKTRVNDLTTVLNQTQDHRARVLVTVAKDLHKWIVMVKKMKAIYHTLNMFNDDVTKKCLIGECWTSVNDLRTVQSALQHGSSTSGSTIASFLNVINTNKVPPTFNRTNRFTRGFQNLIDAYGMATYQEANPALYTIITFPFLFAVMFGDFGHGLIVFLFGLFMVLREGHFSRKKTNNEIWNIFFGGRYIILLMGIFSMYTGLVYNDVFSKSFNIFKSKWHNYYSLDAFLPMNKTAGGLKLYPDWGYYGEPYYFGIDPVWQLADNKIIFLNSFKMKLSIIMAIVHMLFGVCMTLVNIKHFKHYSDILVEFVPHIIFLSSLILYLVFMIFYKWIMFGVEKGAAYGAGCAPSILILFINMMLRKPPDHQEGSDCLVYMYPGQSTVEIVLLLGALISVPIMLCGKPIIELCRRKSQKKRMHENGIELVNNGHNGGELVASSGDEEDEEEPMSEIWINQGIHTIEYCLNTISHTASYLRLWALSLAHAQLSEVLWNMVLKMGFGKPFGYGAIFLFVIFGAWAIFTVSILVLMEGLSAFLHTLRLHWVEFMSKFYQGMGYAFEPFSFKTLLDAENAE